MNNQSYLMSARDCANELQCSLGHAYKLVRDMNRELSAAGYLVIAGKIPRPYWEKKLYGMSTGKIGGENGV